MISVNKLLANEVSNGHIKSDNPDTKDQLVLVLVGYSAVQEIRDAGGIENFNY